MIQKPNIHKTVHIAPGVFILGDTVIEKNCSVWYNSVLRGDAAPIRIGADSNIQECCVLHVDIDFPLIIGKGVTIGHGAILHGCTIGDNTLVGMGATILNGAKIGKNCMVGAGALVPQDMEVPDGTLILGVPAKIRRQLTEQEIQFNQENAQEYIQMAQNLF